MKKAGLEKIKGIKLNSQAKGYGAPDRFGAQSGAPADRREQRKVDQALGLVPFAIKLNSELVKEIHALAQARGAGLSEVVGELLRKGLDSQGTP